MLWRFLVADTMDGCKAMAASAGDVRLFCWRKFKRSFALITETMAVPGFTERFLKREFIAAKIA